MNGAWVKKEGKTMPCPYCNTWIDIPETGPIVCPNCHRVVE
jgi:uncharacterized Zn-finger protein